MTELVKLALEFLKDPEQQRKLFDSLLGKPVPLWLLGLLRWVLVLFLVLSVALAFLALLRALHQQWTELWRSAFLNEDDKHKCRRRQRFSAFIQGQVMKLNLAESWEDYRFAELEAEVEAEGRPRWPRGRFSMFGFQIGSTSC